MNDVAQSALLKTLEEPPPCHDPDPVRRRRGAAPAHDPVALRQGPPRDARDPGRRAAAGRARARRRPHGGAAGPAGGRPPGVAIAYAAAPEAEADSRRARPDAARPAAAGSRGPAGRRAGAPGARHGPHAAPWTPTPRQRAEGPKRRRSLAGPGLAPTPRAPGAAAPAAARAGARRPAGAEGDGRRATSRARGMLLDIWRDLARDLACAQRGAPGSIRDVALLEELEPAAPRLPAGRGLGGPGPHRAGRRAARGERHPGARARRAAAALAAVGSRVVSDPRTPAAARPAPSASTPPSAAACRAWATGSSRCGRRWRSALTASSRT